MSSPNEYLREKSVDPFLVVKGTAGAVDTSGVLPKMVGKLVGPFQLPIDYGAIVVDTIRKITEFQQKDGYSEGYARALTYYVEGWDISDISTLPFIHETTHGVFYVYPHEGALPNQPDHFVVERGKGFFQGKNDAIRHIKKSKSTNQIVPSEFLNVLYKQIAKSKGIDDEHIRVLEYYSAEQIIEMFEDQINDNY
jgi:hypothetical protein